MNYVGIDLHKKTISICVVNQAREVLDRKRFYCDEPKRIVAFFEALGLFQAVVEASAGYEWHGSPPGKSALHVLVAESCSNRIWLGDAPWHAVVLSAQRAMARTTGRSHTPTQTESVSEPNGTRIANGHGRPDEGV